MNQKLIPEKSRSINYDQITFKTKSKSPSKFQIERIYMPVKDKQRLSGHNLLERSSKKHSRPKISYSASMRRLDSNQKLQAHWRWNGIVDYFNNLRREPDISTWANSINENSLHSMLKNYQEKENQWQHERSKLKNDLECLNEELKAIRGFIWDQKLPNNTLEVQATNDDKVIPSFIRACNMVLSDSDSKIKSPLRISPANIFRKSTSKKRSSQTIFRSYSGDKGGKLPIEQSNKTVNYFVTPEISNNERLSSKFFYPAPIDPQLTISNDRLTRMLFGGSSKSDVQINNTKSIFSGTRPKNSKNFSKWFIQKF